MLAISVIVPVYNVEPYLRRCVDSILAQTFTDFELILVDDGSPDNCGAICDEYAEKDGRIRVIHKENGGVSSARNMALAEACGRYIVFADSDDVVHKQWCEKLYSAIQMYPRAWINCNMNTVNLQGETRIRMHTERSTGCEPVSVYALYKGSIAGSPCNKIYDAQIVRRENLCFNETISHGEDTDFNMRYYQFCDQAMLIAEPLYDYHQNAGSASNTYKYNSFDLYRHTYFDRLPYIEQEHIDEYFDEWLWCFLDMLNQVFDSRNVMSFSQKMKYCDKMMHTPEFTHCVNHAPGKQDGTLLLKVLRMRNYYVYWLFSKMYCLKKAIMR